MLPQFVLAMEHDLTLSDLAETVQIYPTNAGVVRKLANQYAATRLEKGFVRSALRWFLGFQPPDPRTDEGPRRRMSPRSRTRSTDVCLHQTIPLSGQLRRAGGSNVGCVASSTTHPTLGAITGFGGTIADRFRSLARRKSKRFWPASNPV